jgi:hypothetical protein
MPALLTVTYTPNYIGNHRICFRTTQPSYCCYTDDSASVVGVSKTIVIDLDDFENCLQDLPSEIGCSDTPLDGYVQPFCVDQGSDLNRVTFIADYPSNPCQSYRVQCNESGIATFLITEPGYGWPVGVVPDITVTDLSGYGSGFTGTVNMQCLPGENFCSIESIATDNSGQGYYFPDLISVDITPPPSCESTELVIDGQFVNGLVDWNVSPVIDGWLVDLSNVPYYNVLTYGPLGGSISQDILSPGRTYLINFERVIVQARSGTVRFIVAAGLYSPSSSAPNMYIIELNDGDTDYDGPLTVTLTAFAGVNFTIYGDSSTNDPLNQVSITEVSVIELCDAVLPQIEVSSVDDCGAFTVPDCNGDNNPAQYQLWGGPQYAINVCAGGAGPTGPKYFISPNAAEPGLGPELITSFSPTGNFFITGNLEWNGGINSPYAPDYLYCEPDIPGGTIENGDILNPGFTYEIIINAFSEGNNNAITISSGANSVSTGNYVGFTPSTPFTLVAGGTGIIIDIPLSDKPTFVGGVSIRQVLNVASCCDCLKYEVINTALTGDPLEFYYTACGSQEITLGTIDPQDTILDICAVPGSIWAKNPSDNRFLEFIVSGIQDC